MTDFGIFDDRAATLWRKPYLDGAVRELTSGNDKSVEQLRLTVEQMILAKKARLTDVRAVRQPAARENPIIAAYSHTKEGEAIVERSAIRTWP
jgi:predicted ATPase